MRAEDTLQYMADFYPTLFPTRKHCLNHLFCTIGNGYEWINGELVDDDDQYVKRYKLRKPIKKAVFEQSGYWMNQHKYHLVLNKIWDKSIPEKYNFSWYPLSKEYSKLYNYPDDIKPDWKELLEECKAMLVEDDIEI